MSDDPKRIAGALIGQGHPDLLRWFNQGGLSAVRFVEAVHFILRAFDDARAQKDAAGQSCTRCQIMMEGGIQCEIGACRRAPTPPAGGNAEGRTFEPRLHAAESLRRFVNGVNASMGGGRDGEVVAGGCSISSAFKTIKTLEQPAQPRTPNPSTITLPRSDHNAMLNDAAESGRKMERADVVAWLNMQADMCAPGHARRIAFEDAAVCIAASQHSVKP